MNRTVFHDRRALVGLVLIAALFVSAMPVASGEDADASDSCGPSNNVGRHKVYVTERTFYDDETHESAITIAGTGHRVTWYFMGGTHHIIHGDPQVPDFPSFFDSGVQQSGPEPPCWEASFPVPGVYPYYCDINKDMRGTVIVA